MGAVVLVGGCAVLQPQALLLQPPQQQALLQGMQLQLLQQCRRSQVRRAPTDLELAAAVESLYLDSLCAPPP